MNKRPHCVELARGNRRTVDVLYGYHHKVIGSCEYLRSQVLQNAKLMRVLYTADANKWLNGHAHKRIINRRILLRFIRWHRDYGKINAGAKTNMAEVVPGTNILPPDEIAQEAARAALRTLSTGGDVASTPGQQGELQHPHPPTLREQANDPTLPGTFTYTPQAEANLGYNPRPDAEQVPMSEAKGVPALKSFLETFIETARDSSDPADQELVAHASGLLESLTYIGERELQQASAGIAAQWKQRLDADPTKIIYLFGAPYRSGTYILDRILEHFSEADLQKYQGRLHLVSDAIARKPRPNAAGVTEWRRDPLPKNHEIFMVDDWVGTVRQMSAAYQQELAHDDDWEHLNIRIQLITATADALQHGLILNDGMTREGVRVPVDAFYTSRSMPDGKPCDTGIHSSTDDRFEIPIQKMVQRLRDHYGQADAILPPLTNIVRPYRQAGYEPANLRRLAAFYGERLAGGQ